jgi:hypothetical protein
MDFERLDKGLRANLRFWRALRANKKPVYHYEKNSNMNELDEMKKQIITNMYYAACSQYAELAKNEPSKTPDQIPGTSQIMIVITWLDEHYSQFIVKP